MSTHRTLSNKCIAWKDAVQEYPKEFLEYCFPEIAQQIDFEQSITFLDTEFLQTSSMAGMTADLLMEAVEKNTNKMILLHLVVQGTKEEDFEKRMADYVKRIEYEFGRYPISLLLLTDADPSFQPTCFCQENHFLYLRVDFFKMKVIEWNKSLDDLDRDAPLFAVFLGLQKEVSLMKGAKTGGKSRYEVKRNVLLKFCGMHRSRKENVSLLRFSDRLVQLTEEQDRRLIQELSDDN